MFGERDAIRPRPSGAEGGEREREREREKGGKSRETVSRAKTFGNK